MRDHRTLLVWQKSHRLVLDVNSLVSRFPRERLSLASQMRRSSESIPTNIVEGCGRSSQKEFANFLQISISSCNELEYQLQLAKDYGAVDSRLWTLLTDKTIEVRRMLTGLVKRVRAAS